MKCYAVIDTNVIVSALISKNDSAATIQVVRAVLDGRIVPLWHKDIITEYAEVMHRPKFHLSDRIINTVLIAIQQYGIEVNPSPTGEIFIDTDDLIFYEVAMEKRDNDAYLVTGNQKHYPIRDFIVTPAEMMQILNENQGSIPDENRKQGI
ncbi:MAG: putative toxin-antitoxin system toxin component, PIN family [Candidatus Ornithomonoglobus sp.]